MKILFGVDRLAVELPLIAELDDEVWYNYQLSFMIKNGTLYIDRETCVVAEASLEVCAEGE